MADGSQAHRAEEWGRTQQRQLGQEVLSQWATEAKARAHGKKLLKWQSTCGGIAVEEAPWRLGRRGKVRHPACVLDYHEATHYA